MNIRTFFKNHPLLVAAIGFVLSLVILMGVPTDGTVLQNTRQEFLLALLTVIFLLTIDGINIIKFRSKGIGFAFKQSILYLVPGFLAFFAAIVAAISSKLTVQQNWPILLAQAVFFYLLLGLFEEGLFRGIMLHAFLSKMGKTYRGLMIAVILNAAIFGFAHILLGWLQNGVDMSFLGLAQAVIKTLSAGIIGFFFSAIYLKTKNLWSVALVHGLYDFLFVAGTIILSGSNSLSYVSADASQAISSIITQSVVIIIYIPLIVKAIKLLRQIPLPELGFYRNLNP